ncbi:hypothetical protein ABZT03_19715 [Streptomyces sp. NPDC005574]|uniref:hypothetical protein n=1 Tax=Streptomyces sp. NPDC005574 TaxID=3156891 RepID=UPI0033B15234
MDPETARQPHPERESASESGPAATSAPPARPDLVPSATRPASWPARLTAAALIGRALLCRPSHRDGASPRVYGFALAVCALCALLAPLPMVRPVLPVLVPAIPVPSGPAAIRLFQGELRSRGLSRALDPALAAGWITGTAALATPAALTALFARPAAQPAGRIAAVRPQARAGRGAD